MDLWMILDICVIAIFLICIGFAYKKGFMRSSYTVISIVLTIVMVYFLQAPFQQYVENTQWGKNIKENITLNIGEKVDKNIQEGEVNTDVDSLSSELGLPKFILVNIQQQSQAVENATTEFVKSISESAADAIIQIISIVLLFLIIRIALFILLRILDAIFKLPVLNFLNKTAGILVGVLNALLIIYILCAAFMWILPVEKLTLLQDAMEKTYVARYFYDNNILMKMFM